MTEMKIALGRRAKPFLASTSTGSHGFVYLPSRKSKEKEETRTKGKGKEEVGHAYAMQIMMNK